MRLQVVTHMRKGTIGPIADDIPSIFPIVAGVLLFIGSVAFVGQQLDARNNYLELRKTGLGLSYTTLAKGYLSDSDFNRECEVTYREYAARRRVNFLITVKKFCHYIDLSSDAFSIQSPYAPHASVDSSTRDFVHPVSSLPRSVSPIDFHHLGLACFNEGRIVLRPGVSFALPSCGNGIPDLGETSANCPLDIKPKNFQSFNYPVAVDCTDTERGRRPLRGVGMLNVIVWRRD